MKETDGQEILKEESVLKIAEPSSLEMMPYYKWLKQNYDQPFYSYLNMPNVDLDENIKKGCIDLGLLPSFSLALNPGYYGIFPGLGLASQGHAGFTLLFSDMLIEDMDDISVSVSPFSETAAVVIKVILGKYLQYTNDFETSWDKADAHILVGDSALRERKLKRYSYIYDLGDLWTHYTGMPMIFSLWMASTETAHKKRDMIKLFYRSLKYSLEESSRDWSGLAKALEGYEWITQDEAVEFWEKIDYNLDSEHYEGLQRFFEDALEIGLIETLPELQFLDID